MGENNGTVLFITCYCGLSRLLPDGTTLEEGKEVSLAPCPKCSAGFRGVVFDGKIIVPE